MLPQPFRSPAIYRPLRGRLYVATLYAEGNREWLIALGIRPGDFDRETKTWRIARKHLQGLLKAMLVRWGRPVHVYADFNTKERCATSCQKAKGDECTCSCMGRRHAGGRYLEGWRKVGPYVLVRDEIARQEWIVDPRISP